MSLRVRLSPAAAAQIGTTAEWWRQHREKASDAFAEDLERGLELIALLPSVGEAVPHSRLAGIRRLLLGRVRYHLYYHHAAESDTDDVLALWHTGRDTGPPI